MRVLTAIILGGLAMAAPAWADDVVQYNFWRSVWADQIRISEADTAYCMEQIQTGLLFGGERSRKVLLQRSVDTCSGGMRHIYREIGRSDADAMDRVRKLADLTLRSVLSNQ